MSDTLVEIPAENSLLRVRGLTVDFKVPVKGRIRAGRLSAVAGVDLDVYRGEILGIVGESGCGKSTMGRALLHLIPASSGEVYFEGTALASLPKRALRRLRRRMQMIFQDPFASLNPRMTIGRLIEEPLFVHSDLSPTARREKAIETMDLVGLNPDWHGRYPHQLSGGQRQRVGIARALISNPTFIVADEPVSALDVSVQAQVVNLLEDVHEELGLTMVFIGHDLAVVRHLCNRIAVMYLGKIVEIGDCDDIYERPRHPYTTALLSAVPVPDPDATSTRERIILSGDVPSPLNPPSGCRFRTRCWKAQDICATKEPILEGSGHQVACHFPENVEELS